MTTPLRNHVSPHMYTQIYARCPLCKHEYIIRRTTETACDECLEAAEHYESAITGINHKRRDQLIAGLRKSQRGYIGECGPGSDDRPCPVCALIILLLLITIGIGLLFTHLQPSDPVQSYGCDEVREQWKTETDPELNEWLFTTWARNCL